MPCDQKSHKMLAMKPDMTKLGSILNLDMLSAIQTKN